MFEFFSLFTCATYRCLESSPAVNEYRKASFSKPAVYYKTSCYGAKTKRSASQWLISVVGAPEQKAIQILSIVYGMLQDKSGVQLRWWCDAPTSYDCKSISNGKWVGYNPDLGALDAPQSDFGAQITFLYYSNGCDPCALLQSIPEGSYMLNETWRMLCPVSDYVFDVASCKTVVCSEYCPLYKILSGRLKYYAPFPIEYLSQASIDGLFQEGGEMRSLGEINTSVEFFNLNRGARCA